MILRILDGEVHAKAVLRFHSENVLLNVFNIQIVSKTLDISDPYVLWKQIGFRNLQAFYSKPPKSVRFVKFTDQEIPENWTISRERWFEKI